MGGSSSMQRTSATPTRYDLELLVSTCQRHVDSLVDQTEHMHACIVAQHDFLNNFVQKRSHTEGQSREGGAFGSTGGGSNVDTGHSEAHDTLSDSKRHIPERHTVMDAESTRKDEMDVDSQVSNEVPSLDSVSVDLMAFIQNTSYQRAENLRAEVKELDRFVRDNVEKYFSSLKGRSVLQRPSMIRYSMPAASNVSKKSSGQVAGNIPTGRSLHEKDMAAHSDGYSQRQINALWKSLMEEQKKNAELERSSSQEIRALKNLLEEEKRNYNKIHDLVSEKEAERLRLKDTLFEKNKDIKKKDQEISTLKKQLEDRDRSSNSSGYNYPWSRPQPRRKASALLFCQRQSDLLGIVCGEITKLLSDKFAMQNTDLMLTRCEGGSAIQEGIPVIVLCINASRLGTDVTNALAGLRLTPFVAVVILHHKDRHALPNQTSDRVLTAPEYKSLGGIYDMAFLSGKGVYQCDMNTTAVTNLVSFIDRFNTG